MIEIYIPRLAERFLAKMLPNPEVLIILGARQVGKTTLLEHCLPARETRLLNLDSPSDLDLLYTVESLAPKEALKRLGSPRYLVIDEAQLQPTVGRLVKSWYDAKLTTKFILSGSSSLNIIDHTAEPLTGRNQKLELPPLLYSEVLRTQSWFHPEMKATELSGGFKDQAKGLLMQHMVYGSYPGSVYNSDKEDYLVNLASDYLVKDILQLATVREPEVVKRLLVALAYQAGQLVKMEELSRALGVHRSTVEKYIDLLEASYVIFRLSPFSRNPRKELFKAQKVYFWDTGIRNALINNFSASMLRSDIGSLFENYVIAELKKFNILHGNEFTLHFWQNKNQSEVDLVMLRGEDIYAYEMKWSDGRKTGKAFTDEYGKVVQTVTASSAPKLFYQLEKRQFG